MQAVHDMPFGARVREQGGVDFRLWAPGAKQVQLLLGDGRCLPAAADAEGWCHVEVPDAAHGTRYQWRIDDELNVPDPASRSNPEGPHAASEVIAPQRFEWTDDDWRGRPWHEAVIYELHVGTFTPEGTYAAAESRLAQLAELGVTAIELMPLGEFPGRFGWGYDGVLLYAPHAAYGTPEQLKRFIQSAHRHGLMVLLDVVYNHFGPDGNYLHRYAPQFASPRHHTPWGAAMNFDGEGAHWVREFMLENALFWLDEYRFDGLRIDAVHAMVDDGSPHIIAALSQRVRAAFPDRQVHLILENDANDPKRLGPPGAPGLYEGQWNGDFHHCLHVLATGEDHTYYAEFASGTIDKLARVLTLGFAREGGPDGDTHLLKRGPAESTLPLMNSVNFLQCHDQVGNRAFGERLAALAQPEAMHLAMAVMLLAPGVPMLFMGEEFESAAPFYYFADANEALREAIRKGRREEFKHVPQDADAAEHDSLPDPCSPLSFERSVIEPPAQWSVRQRRWHDWCRYLLGLRRRELQPLLPGLRTGAHEARRIGRHGLRVRWHFEQGEVLEAMLNLGTEHLVIGTDDAASLAEARELLTVGAPRRDSHGAWSGRWTWGRAHE